MPTVRQALQSALDENGGTIPFDAFMHLALHHPEDGYYTRHVRVIGGRGDFTTVAQRTPALGEAIGHWLRDEAARRGWRRINVIECGPGSGALAAAVMRSFGWLGKRMVRLHLVETSPSLREHQQARVRARWHASIGEAVTACGGRALIYHNEFLDAFPCRVFRRGPDTWHELLLRVETGRLVESFAPPVRPLPEAAALGRPWTEGQRVEVFQSVADWMGRLSASWVEGAMLAIDYGGTTGEIYRRRPGGTLRAYRGQQRLEGSQVFDMPGRQDITADVNFDDLATWARQAGWTAGETTALDRFVPGAPGAEAFRCITMAADRPPARSSPPHHTAPA